MRRRKRRRSATKPAKNDDAELFNECMLVIQYMRLGGDYLRIKMSVALQVRRDDSIVFLFFFSPFFPLGVNGGY